MIGTGSDDALYAVAVGAKKRDYYLERFRAFDAGGSAITWHWPAFFITFWWLLYRKLWGTAALYIVGSYLFSFLLGALARLAGVPPLGASAISLAVLVVLPALFANKVYHYKCRKLIEQAYAQSPDAGRQRSWLAGKGGTSVVAAVVMGMLLAGGIIAAVAGPAYQDRAVKGRAARAHAFGQKVTAAITERYALSGKYPSKQDVASLTDAAPPEVRLADYNPGTGALQLTLAKAPTDHDTFEFMPYLDDQKRLQWQCRSVNMPQRHLPKACWRPGG